MRAGAWSDRLLRRARVAHLATADRRGRPHVIPVCYAFDGRAIYSALDEKPKRVAPARLRRVRNILANPRVAFLVDEYDEDWRRLRYVLVAGAASLLLPGRRDHAAAVARLRRKYPQYLTMRLGERPVLRIVPLRVTGWAARAGRARSAATRLRAESRRRARRGAREGGTGARRVAGLIAGGL